jgi:hypothetical protein
MTEAIFTSTEQALRVSYLILSMPPRHGQPFRNMLVRLLEDLERPTGQQQAWLERLRENGGSGTVNFGGLAPNEVRAQCSMVTAAARDRLPSQEMAAVLARFAVGPEKLDGCKRLALYARRSSGLTSGTLLLELAARHYLPREQREGMTVRALGEKHKVSKDKIFRAAKWMEANFRALENLALSRLEPMFIAHGLVAEATEYEPPMVAAVHA